MSTQRKILRNRKRMLARGMEIDRFARINLNGAAARRRRKRQGEMPRITRAVLKRMN